MFPEHSYEANANEGWIPPGVHCYKNKQDIIADSKAEDIAMPDCVPWGTNGLLYIDCFLNTFTQRYWCRVLWEEKLIYIRYDYLALTKKGGYHNDLP